MKKYKYIYALELTLKKDEYEDEKYYKSGDKETLMRFVKKFKNKKLRIKLNTLLDDPNNIEVDHFDAEDKILYKMEKVEYRRIYKINPNRENERGEKIEEKRKDQSKKAVEIIKSIVSPTLLDLFESEKFRLLIQEMEIERIRSIGKPVKVKNINGFELSDFSGDIVYKKVIKTLDDNDKITLKIELTNSKIQRIKLYYKDLIIFDVHDLFFGDRIICKMALHTLPPRLFDEVDTIKSVHSELCCKYKDYLTCL